VKSLEYSFFVALAFLGSLGEKFDTKSDLIKYADGIAREMGCEPGMTLMTKYNAITELGKDGIITFREEEHHQTSSILSSHVEDFMIKMLDRIEIEDDEEKSPENE